MSRGTQFGFIKAKGIREIVFTMKLLVQKRDQCENVLICFIHYQKAFDKVKHELLDSRLREIVIDERDTRVMKH